MSSTFFREWIRIARFGDIIERSSGLGRVADRSLPTYAMIMEQLQREVAATGGVKRDMDENSFDSDCAANAFEKLLETVVGWFQEAHRDLDPADVQNLIKCQVFNDRPSLEGKLFKHFCVSSQDQPNGLPLSSGEWKAVGLAMLDDFEFTHVAAQTLNGLRCRAFTVARDRLEGNGYPLIGGDVDRHLAALANPRIDPKNPWVALFDTAHEGARLFQGLVGGDSNSDEPYVAVDSAILSSLAEPILGPLKNLTVDAFREATQRLRSVRGIGDAMALHFLRSAGVANAFKPDRHTTRIAGRAFRKDGSNDTIEDKKIAYDTWRCLSTVLAFARALNEGLKGANKLAVSLAAIDRLMWTAGAGRIWRGEPKLFLSQQGDEITKRRAAAASILRRAVRENCFDA